MCVKLKNHTGVILVDHENNMIIVIIMAHNKETVVMYNDDIIISTTRPCVCLFIAFCGFRGLRTKYSCVCASVRSFLQFITVVTDHYCYYFDTDGTSRLFIRSFRDCPWSPPIPTIDDFQTFSELNDKTY